MPGQRGGVDGDRAAHEQDDPELAGHREHHAADDVGHGDLGRAASLGFHGEEDVFQ